MNSSREYEEYREYLSLLGRAQLDNELQGKVDLSDVVQLTLVDAFQHMGKLNQSDQGARLAWLRRAFANNLIDEVRKFRTLSRNVSREVSLERSIEDSAKRIQNLLVDQGSSPSQKLHHAERVLRLSVAMNCLTMDQQRAIELHYIRGLPLAEVGIEMDRDKGAVAGLIFRGTRRLRELLGTNLGELDET